jgi:hypothetical protein
MIASYLSPRFETLRTGAIEELAEGRTWLEGNVTRAFLEKISKARIPAECRDGDESPEETWNLLWGLLRTETLIVEETLRDLLDQATPLITSVHRALWEARFLLREHADDRIARAFVCAFSRWISGHPLSVEDVAALRSADIEPFPLYAVDQVEAACFLLTLAAQNALLSRFVVLFDGLEDADYATVCGLGELLSVLDKWVARDGSPLGVLVGFEGTTYQRRALRQKHPVLAKRVEQSPTA